MDCNPRADRLFEICGARGIVLATAESCTGGLIAGAITDVPGSSQVFDRGFVTYSNDAKIALLGVEPDCLAQHGAVSEAVAIQMALGALRQSRADVSLAVTGIAGPGGGSPEKPVGLVHFAIARRNGETLPKRHVFARTSRISIRQAAVDMALDLLIGVVSG